MTEETTTEQLAEIEGDMADIDRQVAELVEQSQQADYPQPEPEPEPIQVREGRWRTRNGMVKDVTAMPTDHEDFAAAYPWWDGVSTWRDDGRWLAGGSTMDLVEYLGPIEADKTQELPDKTQELPEYTPPEGWRVVRFGEQLLPGDVWVSQDGTEQRSDILHWDASAVSGGRCIRRIKPEPQPQPQPEPVQVREGQWRTRGGDIRNVTPTPEGDRRKELYPWWDAQLLGTWTANGRYYSDLEDSPLDLIRYLGPIEQQPEAEPEPDTELQAQVAFLKGREVTLGTRLQQEKEVTTRLRGELESVQRLLGTEKRRVTELEELVTSLRNITDAQEKAFEAAGKENTALRNQLEAVKAELASVAADRYRLQVELDAAQQVPADSPELRQLRADLAEVTRDRDTYRHAHELLLKDANTVHERTKAMTVEAIAEWLEPVRLVDSPNLANEALQHLPQIMRHLTGLDSHAID